MDFLHRTLIRVRRSIYARLAWFDQLIGRPSVPVVIFCFHSIASDVWRFSHDQAFFEQAIGELLKTRRPVTLDEVAAHIAGKAVITEPSFAVCFDDGYRDTLSVRVFLKDRGIRPAVFVLTQPEAVDTVELGTERTFLQSEDLALLRADGWSIGSHSATHRDFSHLDLVAAEREVTESKLHLEAILGETVQYFAYPKGRYTEAVVRAVERAGYTYAFSMDDGPVDTTTPRYAVPRIGVDRTHSLEELGHLFTPSAIAFRAAVKRCVHKLSLIFS